MTKPPDWIEALANADGDLPRAPLPPSGFFVRRPTALRDGWLVRDGGGFADGKIEQEPKLLERFAALWNAEPERIFKFARRWGLLGICVEHGIPGHRAGHHAIGRADRESVDAWRRISGACSGALEIATALHAGRPAPEDAWRRVLLLDSTWSGVLVNGVDVASLPLRQDILAGLASGSHPALSKGHLVQFLAQWVNTVGIRPVLSWGDAPPRLELQSRHLEGPLGVVGVEMLGAVAKSVRPGFCDACGKQLNRPPRRNQRAYCGPRDNNPAWKQCQKDARRRWGAEFRERKAGEGKPKRRNP